MLACLCFREATVVNFPVVREFTAVTEINEVLQMMGQSRRAVGAEELLTIDSESARLARELKHTGYGTIGLLPADNHVDVLGAGEKLGRALAFVTGSLVALFDPERKSLPTNTTPKGIFSSVLGSGGTCTGRRQSPRGQPATQLCNARTARLTRRLGGPFWLRLAR